MLLSPYWLRTVEVGLWQFHWDGVDVWMLLGDFQLCREKRADPDMSELIQNHHRTCEPCMDPKRLEGFVQLHQTLLV